MTAIRDAMDTQKVDPSPCRRHKICARGRARVKLHTGSLAIYGAGDGSSPIFLRNGLRFLTNKNGRISCSIKLVPGHVIENVLNQWVSVGFAVADAPYQIDFKTFVEWEMVFCQIWSQALGRWGVNIAPVANRIIIGIVLRTGSMNL